MTTTTASKLNEAQAKAATTTEGPLLIIAGPGSGKTHTLVERVLHLIVDKGVKPEEILISTFTEKAAAELITRVSSRLVAAGQVVNLNEMYIGTLHSLCLRILDENREHTRLKRNYTILDQFDQQYLVYQSLKDYQAIEDHELVIGPPEGGRWNAAETLVSWFNKLSEELIAPKQLLDADEPRLKALGALYAHYIAWMETENILDFSSIQRETFTLLDQNPEVTKKLRAQLRYLMVDEYQDTNTVQEAILLKLAGEMMNLCVVGDDDQGLYRFRGATIRNILEFQQNFPKGSCKRVELIRNYRSHADIIGFFNSWMEELDWSVGKKTFRYEKVIEPRDADVDTPKGPAVLRVSSTGGEDGWHKEVLTFLRHLQTSGTLKDWNQVALLFRSVRSDRTANLARFLEQSGIPVYSPRSNLFFDREEVMLFVGGLIFLFPQLAEVLRAKWPKAADPPEVWGWYEACVTRFAEEVKKPEHADLLKWARHRAKDHISLTEETDYAFSGLLYQMLQFPMFARYLGVDALGGVRDSRPARNLALMSRLLTRFEYFHRVIVLAPKFLDGNLRLLFNGYFRFLRDGGIDEFEDAAEYAPSGCVSFMTIHQAKGLEFPVVLVGSLEAVPRKQHTDLDEALQKSFYRKPPFEPLDKTKLYDFWRLYYTAFSRAQNLLVLTCAENTGKGRKVPSASFQNLYDTMATAWTKVKPALAKLTLAKVKNVDLKSRYSFTSHITVYENCARQYKFFKELDFVPVRSGAILFGTLVHQTIEDVHKAAIRGDAAKIKPPQIETWLHANYRQLAAKERKYLPDHTLKSALEQVSRYVSFVEKTYKNWRHIQHAEVDVSLVRDEYILEGSVDLIQGEGDTVEVVDLKAERKPDLEGEVARVQRYRRQLEIYGFLIEQRLKKKVSRLHVHYTGESMGNPRISFPMDHASVQRTIAAFDNTVVRIGDKQFEIEERPTKLCVNCDMKFYCDKT